MLHEWLIYPLLGALAGLLAGLLGVGGGIVIVPILLLTFTALGFPESVLTHLAVGTSLATIVLTSLGSIYQHHRKGAVHWDVLRSLGTGLVLGALLGAWIADWVPGVGLRRAFGLFAILIAVQMLLNLQPGGQRPLPGKAGLFGAGGVIGAVSALFGIGGGSMMVPYLAWCRLRMQDAVGTSSAGGLPLALAGAVGFVLTGWDNDALPSASLGYVYLPAFLGIVVTSILFAQLGARWAHKLPAQTLRRLFACLLIVVGARLLFF